MKINLLFWRKKARWKTYLSIGLLLVFIALVILFNINNPLTFENLKSRYDELMALEKSHPFLFTILLFIFYVLSICLVIPDSTLISVLAGTVYSFPVSVFFISLSETVGALSFFFIVRYIFKEYFKKKEAKILHGNLSESFKEHEIYYLLFLRFSHILPFWLINVIGALFKTSPMRFIWTTFIGTLPLSVILSQAGRDLKKALISNQPFSIQSIMDRPTELALVGIGLLALLPIVLKKYFRFLQ